MKRYLIDKLKDWLKSPSRKPAVIRGARQVGKTWIVRELAKQTGKQLIELNFEKQRSLAIHFESNDPSTILLNLESALNQTIHPTNAILFLDEIQAAPDLLAKLRWFYEDMPELAVITAGSLLEFVLENHTFSMPVGRIQYFFIEPLGFEEFLLAKNETHLLSAIEKVSIEQSFNTSLHDKANQLFKEFITVGGMPEAVSTWIKTSSLEALAEVHNNLINTYQDDFTKYAGKLSITYLEEVLHAVPKLLTKKFIYSHVDPTARHESIKQALNLLLKARLCHKVQSVSANGIPLGAEIKSKIFKIILIDVGLVSTMLGLKLHQFNNIEDILVVNKGALAEQVVGQLLRLLSPFYVEPTLHYWNRELASSSAEIDYLIQDNQRLIPIEVKAGVEGKLRSLHQFMSEKPWKHAIRFYTGPVQCDHIKSKTTTGSPNDYELISLPFYLLGQIYRLLEQFPSYN
ncbi:MAG TPA: AAA family ATPase [Gammaproteobacteria bacterium]|nr:AAA family ATPase [Gammaproteobacteria bacterium]